jgi:hypothetical protein
MKNIVIFGDSYSTYEGWIPDGFDVYYSPSGRENGPAVSKMKLEETWWQRLLAKTGANLLANNSWSGSTVGYTGYAGDCSHSSSFIYRFRQLKESGFFKKNDVDTVFLFGGTNDSWANAPLGEVQFENWTEEDLFFVLPAICHLIWAVKEELPSVDVYFIINTQINPAIGACVKSACAHYGATAIELVDIDKENGHPTPKGMEMICNQVLSTIQ